MATKEFVFSGVLWTDRTDFYPTPYEYAQLYPAVTPFLSAAQARYNPNSMLLPAPDFKAFEHRAAWRYQYLDINDGAPGAFSDPGAGVGTPRATITTTFDTATGVTLDASIIGSNLEIWDSTLATYKGVCLITAVSGSDLTLAVVSNPGSATQTHVALADNDRCYVVGTAHGESSSAPEASSDELEVVHNSTHLERTSLEISEHLKRAVLRGEQNELQRMRMEKGNEHKIKQARAFYFGARSGGIGGVAHGAGGGTDATSIPTHMVDANSKTVRQTMGIWSALRRYGRRSGNQQNWFEFIKNEFSYNDIVDISEKISQYDLGDDMKEWYCGPGATSFFAKAGREGLLTKLENTRVNLDISPAATGDIGLVSKVLTLPHCQIRLINDPLLRNTPYHDAILGVTPRNVELVRYMQDTYAVNIKTDNNPLIQKDEFLGDCGIRLRLVETMEAIFLT